MTKQTINIGTSVNKGDGDPLRTAFTKINENFTELYNSTGGLDLSNITESIIPSVNNTLDLGSPTRQWRHVYTAGGSIYLDDIKLTNVGGKFVATKVINPGEENEAEDPEDSDASSEIGGAANLGNLKIESSTIGTQGQTGNSWGNYNLYLDPGGESNAYINIPSIPNQENGNALQIFNKGDATSIVQVFGQGGVQVVTNTGEGEEIFEFRDDGKLQLPPGGDILDSNGDSVLGGAAGPVQPYLELTDTPFITRPVILGTPVTVTVPLSGINAQVQVDISEGSGYPILSDVIVITPGTGYVPGTTYKIYSYQIGGSNDATDSITFTIDTVNGSGGILTVANAAFTGVATNNPASYNVSIDYQPVQIFDEISPGLTLTRDNVQGIYNSAVEPEYDNSTYLSPLGTEWNSDGWGDLTGIGTRSYTTWRAALNNQVGNNIVASELVMHDIANDRYYKFDFASWGGSNGGYSYTRTEVTDPNYFKKDDYATANNIDVIEDDSTIQIGITRGENNGIYNPFLEVEWNENVSPQGTVWNVDGWNDLTDVETRTYTNLYAAFGNGGLGNKIVGTECVMYVPSIEKYYAVKFLSWTQNNMGGGFSYTRKEIDLTKLNEGIKFQDGTVLKSALGTGRVKSTAAGNRRIEEVTGYNQVAVTARVTNNYTGSTSQTTNGYELRVARTPELDAVFVPINQGSVNATFTLSYDDITYRAVWLSSVQQTEYWFYYEVDNNQTTPQTEGDTVYITVTTGADPVVWWDKADLPGSSNNFRGAVIDYHAYTGESTIIGTIHIVDDDGEEHISHQEVQSGSTDGENDDLWLVTTEGQIKYRRIDGESKTLKIHWTAKVFYGSELYD